jgi:hypothetical protein
MQCLEFKVIVSKDTQRADREVNGGNTANFAWRNNGGILMIKTVPALPTIITERVIARATIHLLRMNYFSKIHKMLLPSRPMKMVNRCQPAT